MKRRFAFIAVGIIGAFLFAGPIVARAQEQADFRPVVTSLAGEARRFQDPQDALYNWGDPQRIDGVMAPWMSFLRRPGLWVALQYAPPARSPRRLETITVTILPGPTEEEIRAWLGNPSRVESGGDPARVLIYEGRDRAHLSINGVGFQNDRVHFFLAGSSK